MRIVVFSGTTEGRDFSRAAAALGIAVTVSVATDLGAEEQGQAPGISFQTVVLTSGNTEFEFMRKLSSKISLI